MFIGTTTGIVVWDGNNSYPITELDGLPEIQVNSICEDSHGNLFIGTFHGLFIKRKWQKFEALTIPSKIQETYTVKFFNNEIYASGGYGAFKISNYEKNNSVQFTTVYDKAPVVDFLVFNHKTIFTTEKGIYSTVNNKVEKINIGDSIASPSGLFAFHNNKYYVYYKNLYEININSLQCTLIRTDNDPGTNKCIFSTSKGLFYGSYYLNNLENQNMFKNQLHDSIYFYGICGIEIDNKILIGSERGLLQIEQEKISPIKFNIEDKNQVIYSLKKLPFNRSYYLGFNGDSKFYGITQSTISKQINTIVKDINELVEKEKISVIEYRVVNNNIYILTRTKGLFLYNVESKEITHYSLNNAAKDGLYVIKQIEDKIYIFGGAFVEISEANNKLIITEYKIENLSRLRLDLFNVVKLSNSLLIGSNSWGLVYINTQNKTITEPKNINPKFNLFYTNFFKIKDSLFIASTQNSGLLQLIISNNEIKSVKKFTFPNTKSLYDLKIISINNGRGVSFSTKNKELYLFDCYNVNKISCLKLQNFGFSTNAYCVNYGDSILSIVDFANSTLNEINSAELFNKYASKPITGFINKVIGNFGMLDQLPAKYIRTIQSINIHFNFPNYTYQTILGYHITTMINNKIISEEISTENSIKINFFTSGEYKITIVPLGVYNYKPLLYEFTVNNPWYQSLWFILICALIGAFLLYLITKIIINVRTKNAIEAQQKAELLQQLSESELIALKSQINPHFVQNMFTIIASRVRSEEPSENIVGLIKKTATWFKQILRMSDLTTHTVSDEKAFLTQYLGLTNEIHPGLFSYSIRIDEHIQDPDSVLLPTMVVQPFVENCIKYAFDKPNKNNEICIDFKSKLDLLQVIISDNGIGFNEKEINKSKSFYITQKRILLATNNTGTIEYKNNNGTTVILTLPKNVVENHTY